MGHKIPLILCITCFVCATSLFTVAFYGLLQSSSASTARITSTFIPEQKVLSSACAELDSELDTRGSRLFHSWSDEELFQRAVDMEKKQQMNVMERQKRGVKDISRIAINSSSTSESSSSFPSVSPEGSEDSVCHRGVSSERSLLKPKVAFMFLTGGQMPFLPLWKRFFHGHEDLFNIYIHLDPFRVGVFERNSSDMFWGRLIPPGLTERGAPSLAAAMRRLIANALLDDPLNQYFAVFSETCIPLVSFPTVYSRLTASDKSFIEILTGEPTLQGRYASRGGEAAMLPEVPFSAFRVGSQFFVLTRHHALTVVSDSKIWSKFSTPCSDIYSCYIEEHYFPTLIDMADGRCATRFTLTNVDWNVQPNIGHPRTYQEQEITRELIFSLRRNGTFLFARKFAGTCLEPLLKLSAVLLEKDMD
ncbi:hypothetical protein KP509_18G049800 [Ceratopteris richardii]|uniref:Glycosyltransferase n=1 Tax=Ceratopteris richardii TaxID=49495 RepID=A0A8T2SPG3_CERRI|nr:hypothetical protein KP509_18G049800 [Ceratopteris richardii]